MLKATSLADEADRSVVERVLAGERQAYALLVRRHGDGLYRLGLRWLGSPALAEEVAQETFARAWSALGRFRGETTVRAWLYGIAANLCRDIHRSRWWRDRPAGPAAPDPRPPEEPAADPVDDEARLDDRRVLRALEGAIAELPDGMRRAFELRVVEGLAYDEVAAVLGLGVGAVKVRVHRARQRLHARLGPLLDDVQLEVA